MCGIPKSKPCSRVDLLKPISLTSTLSKIQESYVNDWIYEDVYDKISSSQFGSLPGTSTVCIKKRLVFEIQISHNYSDLIVLKCVELMIRDKNVSYLQKRSIGHVPQVENLLFYDSLNDSKQLYLSGKFNTL